LNPAHLALHISKATGTSLLRNTAMVLLKML